ncbi:MAG TPA: ABC transporter permease [Bacteroidota bacterium]|nr:ABC transporter permease [Bacteroidota bacterium]
MELRLKLCIAALKMFIRQREAILWTVLFPLLLVLLFGFVRFGGIGRLSLGVVNDAGQAGADLITHLKSVGTFDVSEGTSDEMMRALSKGDKDVVLMLPAAYAPGAGGSLMLYGDVEAKPRETQLASLILQRVLDEALFERSPALERTVLRTQAVKSRNLTYIDFLLPGVLSLSIMQSGIFGVAFSFVSLKKRGILRRLWVTPIRPSDFITAQVLTRLVVQLLQMSILVGVGILLLNLHFIGNLALIYLLGILGAVVFLGFGFALAGISKSEDQVAPLANIITLPMLALSGVFFSRAFLPGILRAVTSILPLTYLADGIRSVAIEGATFTQVVPELLGLLVWALLSCALAIRFLRWE